MEYKKIFVANFDFATLYPNTMRNFSLDDKMMKELKQIERRKKLERILKENSHE